MRPVDSVEYFTQDEGSDGSRSRHRGRSRQRHTRITVPPIGNVFITPANSSTSHKYQTPNGSTSDAYKLVHTTGRNPSPHHHHGKKHHHRSRSLSIHIRPASCSPKRHQQQCQTAQTSCGVNWAPPYNPPSKSCSTCSTISTPCCSSQAQCATGSNYHVYQPVASERESQLFCADQVLQNLCEDQRSFEPPSCSTTNFQDAKESIGGECGKCRRREPSSGCFEGNIKFNCVGNLPSPDDVRKQCHSRRDRHQEESDEHMPFPFKKTPSGHLKICSEMVAFQSRQIAVLVDNPNRTRVNLKQSRHWCGSKQSPPPIPPMPDDPSDGSLMPGDEDFGGLSPERRNIRPEDKYEPYQRAPRHHNNNTEQQQNRACSRSAPICVKRTASSVCNAASLLRNDNTNMSCCENSQEWDVKTSGQCRSSKDFHDSFHYRLRRAIHPDMKVMVGGREFPCHSIALQAYSHYFDNLKRPRETIHCVKLPDDILSPEDFPNLMDWILLDDASKPRVISCENVLNLYCAASFLGMPGLKEHCICFLNEKVQAGDPVILQMYEEARVKPRCKDLLSSLTSKLVQLFPIMYKTKQFLNLGVQELVTLLESDDIKTQSELQVYDTALRWLLFDWKKRCDDAVRVMSCVRFGLLSPLQLTQIQHYTNAASSPDHCRIFSIPPIKKLLQDGLTCAILRENYKARPGELNKWLEMSCVKPPRPRCNFGGGQDIFDSVPQLTSSQGLTAPPPPEPPTDFCGPCQVEVDQTDLTNDKSFLSAQTSDSNTAVRDVGAATYTKPKATESAPCSSMPWSPSHQTMQRSPPSSSRIRRSPSPRLPPVSSSTQFTTQRSDTSTQFQRQPGPENHDDQRGRGRCNDGKQEGKLEMASENLSVEPDLTPAQLVTEVPATNSQTGQGEPAERPVSANRFSNHAAELIQAQYQGYVVRRKFLTMRAAAIKIQRFYRAHRHRSKIHSTTTESRTKMLVIPGREVVLVFGGMNPKEEYSSVNNDCQTVYRFNPDENLWADMGKLPEPRSHCGAVVIKDMIYVFGGSDPRKLNDQGKSLPSSKCWRLNPRNGKWDELTDMKVARTNFTCCNFHGKIYVFGGKNTFGDVLSSCERFDPSVMPKGAWSFVMPMPIPCMSMAATKYGDKVYVIGGVGSGGSNGSKRPILNSVFTYDPKTNAWEEGPPLAHGRCYCSAQGHYNRLYVSGGAGKESETDGTRSLRDVLAFEDGRWETVGMLKRPRHGHCMVKIGKYFLILGGVSSETMEPLDMVELYNTETHRSSSRIANVPHKLTGMTAVVI